MAEDGDAAQAAANAFIREVWGLQGAGYVVLMLRYLAHFMFGRSFAWDDFLMALATVSLRDQIGFASEYYRHLHSDHSDRLHCRICSRILRGGLLEGPREQWHDRRAEGSPPAQRPGVGTACQWFKDTRYRFAAVHDRPLAAQRLLGCLLQPNDVRLF